MIGMKNMKMSKQKLGVKNNNNRNSIGVKNDGKYEFQQVSSRLLEPIMINEHKSINTEPTGLNKNLKKTKKSNSLEKY